MVWASRGLFGGCWGWGFGFRGALKPTARVAVGVGSRGVLWGWVSGFQPVGDIGCDCGAGVGGGGGWLFAFGFFLFVVEIVGLAAISRARSPKLLAASPSARHQPSLRPPLFLTRLLRFCTTKQIGLVGEPRRRPHASGAVGSGPPGGRPNGSRFLQML